MQVTRRALVGSMAASAALAAKEWKPKLGVLGNFTEANVAFAREEGFTSMILAATPRSTSSTWTSTPSPSRSSAA